jgi:hypothetical protein
MAACAPLAPAPNTSDQAGVSPASGADGHVGVDGGPLVSDRGIGGTGAPNRVADRGIGGTGIVGVVTGFGSVFVDGIEVRYDDNAPVDIDGTASSVAALRAGQLVAIQADGPVAAPYARTISVRSAVTGRIEALELGSGTLTIGGQPVSVPEGTWGANHFGLGDWVKVSGLRRADGTIVASRLDAAPAGVLSAGGPVVRDGTAMRVGSLLLPDAVAAGVKEGQFVVVSGDYAGGRGRVATVVPDPMFADPAGYFGPSVQRLIVQAFVHVDEGAVSLNGMTVRAQAVVAGAAHHDGIAVVSLERGVDGTFTAVGLRYAGFPGRDKSPVHRGAGTDSSQASPRGGRAPVTPAVQPEEADAGPVVNGRMASVTADADAIGGSLVAGTAGADTPLVVVPNPVVTPETATQTVAKEAVSAPSVPVPVTTPSTPASVVTPSAPVTPAPPTGPPMVEKGGMGIGSTNPVISSSGGNGNVSPSVKRHATAWHGHIPSRAVTLKGSTSGPTLNLVTGAVTSGATAAVKAGGAVEAGTGTTTIGTSAGKHATGTGVRRHAR